MMTRTQLNVALCAILATLAETTTAPEGHVYAALMGHGYTLEDFQAVMNIAAAGKLITRSSSHEITLTPFGRAMADRAAQVRA